MEPNLVTAPLPAVPSPKDGEWVSQLLVLPTSLSRIPTSPVSLNLEFSLRADHRMSLWTETFWSKFTAEYLNL